MPRHRALPCGVVADPVGPERELAERLSVAEVGDLASRGRAELVLGEQNRGAMAERAEREHLGRQHGGRRTEQRGGERSGSVLHRSNHECSDSMPAQRPASAQNIVFNVAASLAAASTSRSSAIFCAERK